jgi:preprotein translocase subunit SecG
LDEWWCGLTDPEYIFQLLASHLTVLVSESAPLTPGKYHSASSAFTTSSPDSNTINKTTHSLKMLANIISVALAIMATAKASPIGTMPDTKEVNSTTLETPDVKAAAGYAGRFTHYAPGLGACGQYHSGADWIVALSRTFLPLITVLWT